MPSAPWSCGAGRRCFLGGDLGQGREPPAQTPSFLCQIMEDRQMDARKAGIGIAVLGLLLAGLGLAARPAAVPRDPDKVYQSGSAVGNVIGAKEDKARGVV